jgi:hypothetical protein
MAHSTHYNIFFIGLLWSDMKSKVSSKREEKL